VSRKKLLLLGFIPLMAALLLTCLLWSRSIDTSKATACVGNLRVISVAAFQYEEEHGISPYRVATNTDELLDIFVKEGLLEDNQRRLLRCGHQYSYEFIAGKGGEASTRDPNGEPVLRDPTINSHTSAWTNTLYLNGHIEHYGSRESERGRYTLWCLDVACLSMIVLVIVLSIAVHKKTIPEPVVEAQEKVDYSEPKTEPKDDAADGRKGEERGLK
jgi:hypothetical protein